jgi:DpnII restriction endonuclease
LEEFVRDDVAVLGVADGLAALNPTAAEDKPLRKWLVEVVDREPAEDGWSERLRALAAELLDGRGRLQRRVAVHGSLALALDLCLRHRWPQAYLHAAVPDRAVQQALMKTLLVESLPEVGELERAVIWLKALDLLAEQAAVSLVPSGSDTTQLLRNTQAALKRWIWEDKARRKNTEPARWLIDNEYHVQAFLWSVLYPVFGEQLCDEVNLPGYGLLQPRADLGIVSLKLIIEVKILRERADFEKVEEEISGDLRIYFSEHHRFDRLIAYAYDDCDTQYPEFYDILRGALRQRDIRIEEVVIIRRPSMIPARSARKT